MDIIKAYAINGCSQEDVDFYRGYVFLIANNLPENNFRTALVNHYMSAESMLPWNQDGKLEPTEDLRDIVMVVGTGPYAHKPLVDVNNPYLRSEVLKIETSL
jgi:hypothetical protein